MSYQIADAAARAEGSAKVYSDSVMIRHLRWDHEMRWREIKQRFPTSMTHIKEMCNVWEGNR